MIISPILIYLGHLEYRPRGPLLRPADVPPPHLLSSESRSFAIQTSPRLLPEATTTAAGPTRPIPFLLTFILAVSSLFASRSLFQLYPNEDHSRETL